MRTFCILVASLGAFAAFSGHAEARRFGGIRLLRPSVGVPLVLPVPARATAPVQPERLAQTSPAPAATPATVPPAPQQAASAEVKAAMPWCPTDRYAGAGKGFCLVN